MFARLYLILVFVSFLECAKCTPNCRESRSSHLRMDGGLCFEIAPWQHQPVEMEKHLSKMRSAFGNRNSERRQTRVPQFTLDNREINRYIATVIAPFLDTYHRNIQNSYQQLTNKILKKIKDEINNAITKKMKIYTELAELAESLKVPPMCDEERRASRTLASKHVARIYKCTEQARSSVAEMGKYAEEMITITRSHMDSVLTEMAQNLTEAEKADKTQDTETVNATACLKELSKAAVALGYELDLSLTNARRHNEQSCEKLINCCNRARKNTEDEVMTLRQYLYQCVYA